MRLVRLICLQQKDLAKWLQLYFFPISKLRREACYSVARAAVSLVAHHYDEAQKATIRI